MATLFTKTRTNTSSKKRVYLKHILLLFVFITLFYTIYGYQKPLPEGLSFEGEVHRVNNVELLFDLTYKDEGKVISQQSIFERVHSIIDSAEDFIVLDMFLLNDDYNRLNEYPSVAMDLTQALIQKQKQNTNMKIIVITDPINTFYGSYDPDHLTQLEENDIHLVYTDLSKLRDSNPIYSGLWRTAFQWFGTAGNGWLPNPFSPDSPEVTLRSYLELLNFKANHRKVLITEKEALVTSANPHDASSYHSNIAFVVKGDLLEDLIESEKEVAMISGAPSDLFDSLNTQFRPSELIPQEGYCIQLLTEGKIKEHLLYEINKTNSGDAISIGVFYISDRDLIEGLLKAAKRDVDIRLILDANKDAFGREKNGVPNRPVAHELVEKSNNRIQVRWYNTNGEQYHTKLAIIKKSYETVLIGGSANFTKRNIDDFNLETNLKIISKPNQDIVKKINNYYERLWTNDEGTYTLDYEEYADDSFLSQFLYRFQESSGMSTF